MSAFIYDGAGVLRQRWDDATRLYTTFDPSGVQTGQRPYTALENQWADTDGLGVAVGTNWADLVAKARTALTNNAAFLAINSPTTAQAVTQVKALTRQTNALIKLQIGDLANTDGT